ncbi:MAG: HRDC domain-containing protein [Candidatus Hydrogenedentes bacterium]|nr:HRDC domain-containing protein [Candidatus Hydrogenedentota bacterium]
MSELPPYEWIDSEETWQACAAILRRAPRVAIDIESNSLYAYRETVCLIQISVPGHDFIIDPLAGFPLDALGKILVNPKTEKVLHASEYDLTLLKRHYGWDLNHLFDTMWAARVLGYSHMGLAWFLREFYGVEQRKRLQKSNWHHRPLTAEQLAYAQVDTHYLLALRDDLEKALTEKGRLTEAQEIFVAAAHVRLPDRDFDPDGFWYLRGARELSARRLAALRELYLLREAEAQRRDLPPFKVLSNEALMRLAIAMPKTLEDLAASRCIGGRSMPYLGPKVLQAVQRGRKGSVPVAPDPPERQPCGTLDRYERLLQWRKNLARSRGVESDVILTRESMWAIALHNPNSLEHLAEVAALGPHRLHLYGNAILAELT